MKEGVCLYQEFAWIHAHPFPLFLIPLHQWRLLPATPSSIFFPTETDASEVSLDNSTMFTSNAAAAKSLGKRKMREVAAADHRFSLHNHHLPSSSDGRRSRVQNILNNAAAAPVKPFSYMALLTADDDEDDNDEYYHPISNDIKNPSEQINQMIMYHNENLRHSVVRVLEKHEHTYHHAAEERATKKLRESDMKLQEKEEQNAELERLVELYKGEAERLLSRVRYLERTATSLSEARQYAEAVEEEAESSFEDPDRVGPVRLDCKVCERQLATVMVWPCRHVCVCKRCDVTTKYCPVCRLVKTTSVEVSLPLD